MSWMENMGRAAAGGERGEASRLETLVAWAGALLVLLILGLNLALGERLDAQKPRAAGPANAVPANAAPANAARGALP